MKITMEHRSPPSAVRRTRSGNTYTVLLGGPDSIGGADIIIHQQQSALPGRVRRKRDISGNGSSSSGTSNRRRRRNGTFIGYIRQLLLMIRNMNIDYSLLLAILLWYSLGVLSIASSKILLTGGEQVGIRVNPLSLTLQQLIIGVTLFRLFLSIGFMNSPGLISWPPSTKSITNDMNGKSTDSRRQSTGQNDLFMAAISFAFGFLATNYAFSGSAASFVETVKAAEPITSATVAVAYGIETITIEQQASLGTIIAGVLLSTLGGAAKSNDAQQTKFETIKACAIVMVGNVCFSFRGLYQKLFRKNVSAQNLDDLNLQFRMQWLGVLILSIPTLLFDILPYLLSEVLLSDPPKVHATERHLNEILTSKVIARYMLFSLFNGVAFSCYNLASTWILSRISVVHHAALNCIRRVFAVIVTSIYFGIPITFIGALGITLAVMGFLSYTHYKVLHQQQSSKQQFSTLLLVP